MKRLMLERTDGHHAYKRGILILNGGKSSRMGQNKSNLPWGEGTLLTELLRRARAAKPADIIISSNEPINLEQLPGTIYASHPMSDYSGHAALCEDELRAIQPDMSISLRWVISDDECITMWVIPDEGESKGPLSGLLAGLRKGNSEVYLAVSVDMPFFDHFDFATTCDMLTSPGQRAVDCVVPMLHGHVEPMGALYSRRCVDAIKTLLQRGEYRVQALFETVNTEYFNVDEEALQYRNVNTVLDYKLARSFNENLFRQVPIISVSAEHSGCGKTTVATELIKEFSALGYEVSYVKSDRHGFMMDKEGSDTWRASQAGAKSVVISGPDSYAMISKQERKINPAQLAEQLLDHNVDLVVLETRSQGVMPIVKVESVREHAEETGEVEKTGSTLENVVDARSVIAVVSAEKVLEESVETTVEDSGAPAVVATDNFGGTVGRFGPQQMEELAKWLLEWVIPKK